MLKEDILLIKESDIVLASVIIAGILEIIILILNGYLIFRVNHQESDDPDYVGLRTTLPIWCSSFADIISLILLYCAKLQSSKLVIFSLLAFLIAIACLIIGCVIERNGYPKSKKSIY